MKLTFIGADHEVTGSCHFLEVGDTKVLIDCGMEQGNNPYQNAELPVSYSDIDYVFLTHAHIDHAGMLPWIYARGFKGQIITTYATADLCGIMLRDSAHIQEMEAEWRNRKARRAGKTEVEARYTMQYTEGVLGHFEGVAYGQKFKLNENITLRFTDVGHLLGSASIEIWATEGDEQRKIVFSGDIGNKNKPLIRDPQYISDGDYVVMESTYGNRYHKKGEDHVVGLARIIQQTLDRQGNVVIPAFAVGRTQELLYMIRHIKEEKLVTGHDGFQVYVDSPLAVEATHVFKQNMVECYDEETKALVERGINPIDFPGLKLSVTSEESKNINFDMTPKVIISAAGMCDAGRIRHHLKHNLWNEKCTVMFVGYQAIGTLGRALLEGAKDVKLFGESIHVAARICNMPGISGHADVNGLMEWAKAFKEKPKKVFVTHGNDEVTEIFAKRLHEELGYNTMAPFSGTIYDLTENTCVYEATGVKIEKVSASPKASKAARAFEKLLSLGYRLLAVIKKNEGIPNKDLERFSRDIQSLCDKWDR